VTLWYFICMLMEGSGTVQIMTNPDPRGPKTYGVNTLTLVPAIFKLCSTCSRLFLACSQQQPAISELLCTNSRPFSTLKFFSTYSKSFSAHSQLRLGLGYLERPVIALLLQRPAASAANLSTFLRLFHSQVTSHLCAYFSNAGMPTLSGIRSVRCQN